MGITNNNKEAKELLKKYKTGVCTPEEKVLLESWYIHRSSANYVNLSEEELDSVLDEIWGTLPVHTDECTKIRRMYVFRIAAAASVLIFLSIGSYFLLRKPVAQQHSQNQQVINIVQGSNKATLTLANGHQIILAGAKNGMLVTQGNIAINKTSDGHIAYRPADGASAEVVYNTMSTPRGGQFSLTLSDGTRVWLNSASSIRYPSVFKGNERKVEITGEAYFEVVHNPVMPFKVVANGQTVEDLGTHFNINAYHDEPVLKTTLIEGSVRVLGANEGIVLKPGQQSQFAANNRMNIVYADTSEVVAWKNGLFKFRNANFQEVMRQLSRWYDVKVDYQGSIPNRKFSGEITRNVNISEVLDIMSFLKVHFSIKNNGQESIITVINN